MTEEYHIAENFVNDAIERDEAITTLQINDLVADLPIKFSKIEVETYIRALAKKRKVKIL